MVCGGISFYPHAIPGAEGGPTSSSGLRVQGCQLLLASKTAPTDANNLVSSVVVVGVEDRPPFGDLGCALRHRPTLVLRSHPGVAPWLPHEGFANGEGGRGYELVPPGAVLRQVCPLGEHRRKAEVVQVALKRPALGHLLAAGNAGLSDP